MQASRGKWKAHFWRRAKIKWMLLWEPVVNAKSSNSQISAALADCKKQRQEMCCAVFLSFFQTFLYSLPSWLLAWCLSRAVGCFTSALSLPDRDNPRAGMLGQWQWLQMDAMSPSQWSGPTRYDLPVLPCHCLVRWSWAHHVLSHNCAPLSH